VDFTSQAAAVPDGYRFAAWRAFPCELRSTLNPDLLKPPPGHPLKGELHSRLLEAYANLRRACWGANGECLSRWGREVLTFDLQAAESDPDQWHPAHTDGLRRLAAALTMLHTWFPLQPAPSAATPTGAPALRFAGGGLPVHSREACQMVWGEIRQCIAKHANATNAPHGAVYVVAGARGLPPQGPGRIPLAGLGTETGPTYGVEQSGTPDDATQPHVVAVAAEAVEACLFQETALELERIPGRLADIVAGLPLG